MYIDLVLSTKIKINESRKKGLNLQEFRGEKMNKLTIMCMVFVLLSTSLVFALPVGPSTPIDTIKIDRWLTWGTQNVSAIAGNVMIMNGITNSSK